MTDKGKTKVKAQHIKERLKKLDSRTVGEALSLQVKDKKGELVDYTTADLLYDAETCKYLSSTLSKTEEGEQEERLRQLARDKCAEQASKQDAINSWLEKSGFTPGDREHDEQQEEKEAEQKILVSDKVEVKPSDPAVLARIRKQKQIADRDLRRKRREQMRDHPIIYW